VHQTRIASPKRGIAAAQSTNTPDSKSEHVGDAKAGATELAMLDAALVASRRLAGFTWLFDVAAALSEMAPWHSLTTAKSPSFELRHHVGPVFH
jgi:hypothetical protein